MSNYVTFSKKQFERSLYLIRDELSSHLRYINEVAQANTWEYVYNITTMFPEIHLKVFSSVSKTTNKSREKGTDAIRCVAFYQNKQIFQKTVHTKRLNTWEKNLTRKILEILKDLETVPTCYSCGKLMIQRKSKHGIFWGCSNYPSCDATMPLHPKDKIILKKVK